MRGKTITQDKMLHDAHPLVDLLGQISGSNAGSNSLVKIVGRICWSNSLVKLLVEFVGQIGRSNSWIKFLGQICRSNAANPWPAAGQPRRTHGHACGQAENGLGRAGKGQRKSRALRARPVVVGVRTCGSVVGGWCRNTVGT